MAAGRVAARTTANCQLSTGNYFFIPPKIRIFTYKTLIIMKKLLLALAIIAVAGSSCRYGFGKRVSGNGTIQSEEHTVTSFKNVLVSDGMDVSLLQGEVKPVKIETDDNLLQYVEVIQQGDDLVIREKKGYDLDPSNKIKVYVTTPVYHRVHLSGAGTIESEGKIMNPDEMEIHVSGAGAVKMDLKAPAVKATLSGAGSIALQGDTKDIDISLSGAGSAHCFGLLAENAKVSISGVGNADVYASVSMEAHVSGIGSVKYKGGASNVSQHVSGTGSVSKAD